MPINTERKTLNLNKGSINQNISEWIEQDIIVPDSKPDAVKVINVTVTPYVTDIEVMDGRIKVVGKLNYFIIYRVSDDKFNTRGLFVTHPYTEVLEVKGVNKGMNVTITPVTKNVIFSLPNERKIAVKTEVLFKVRVRSLININLINRFNSDDSIECQMNRGIFNNILKNRKTVISSREDIMLPKEAEDFFEILKVDASIRNTEFKESYNKIMVKGDIELKIIYLAESNDEPVKNFNTTIPFSSMIEVDSITDNSKFNINYLMQDFNLRQNTDITSTKALTADYQIEVDVDMYENEEIEYVEDFYSQRNELQYDSNVIDVVRQTVDMVRNIEIKENMSNILQPNMRVLDYDLDINNVTATVNGRDIKLDGNAKIYIIVQDIQNMELDSKAVDILVNQNISLEDVKDPGRIFVNLVSDNLTITQNGNDIEARIVIQARIELEDVSNMNIIDNIVEDKLNTSNLDSMNIYIVKAGDSLWSIAKKYKTSVDKIVKTNGIVNPNAIEIGQKIFIIR